MVKDARTVRAPAVSVEHHGIERIPDDQRHGSPRSAFSLWFAGNLQYSALAVGAIPTAFLGLSFGEAVVSLTIGILIGSVLLGFAASMGPRAGVPQMIQSRIPFGYYGNFLPVLLLCLTGLGYFAVNTVLGAYIVRELFGLPFLVSLVAVAAVQIVIAIVGHDLVHQAERFLAVVASVLFLILTWYGLAKGNLGAPGDVLHRGAGGVAGGMLTTVALASTRTFGWSIGGSDYTRYLPRGTSRRRVLLSAFSGAALAGLWMAVVGAAIGTVISVDSPTDLVAKLIPSGLAAVILVALLAASISGSVLDIYTASLGLLMVGVAVRRWISAVIIGVLGTAVGFVAGHDAGSVFGTFQNFLFLMGYWIGPWLGIVVVDAVVFGRGEIDPRRYFDRARRIRPGLAAFVIAVAVSVPFMDQSLYTGAFAARFPQFGDITPWVGGAVAALAYYLIRRYRKAAQ
ncbi:purine-cytosine permease family protein [Amycolatopsis silviterrae]|uniref:Purine-cytosine permease family protein n=1 Tax=Amycolatopsis silviterrae TaxID=1656914 RepID=A0ABW5H2P0_9PSEU